ncbi:MAG: methyltransferase domain-containing protein [Verrucomicrobiales bacterium]
MNSSQISKLAGSFAGVSDRCYVHSKLRSDPLYEAVLSELQNSTLPLLDLGCGLGLLAFFLRDSGLCMPIHSLDYDERKIEEATRLASHRGEQSMTFAHHDARQGLPDHLGNVTILDILQFFQPDEIEKLLHIAADRVSPGGKLILRSGLKNDSWRFRITVAGDLLAKATFWMKAAPVHYPCAEDFKSILGPHGTVRISPLWGKTPFNNHLIVLQKTA